MRHFLLFIIFFFSFYSNISFAIDSPDGGKNCTIVRSGGFNNSQQCSAYASIFASDANVTNLVNDAYTPPMVCNLKGYRCAEPCPAPRIYNPTAKTCSPPPTEAPDDCDGQPKVYDPVTGTMVCPASGDGGSASSVQSSNMCVVPGDFNGDCVPDDSSAPPTSSPDSGSAGSAASAGGGGDDGGNGGDGGDDGGGGGSPGGNPGTGGGGSSASASSAPASGSNHSWNPYAGYGNWIPVAENSTCPNKYKDVSGQTWCAGNSGQFGSAASAASASGACDPTATNYFTCITSGAGSNTSTGSNSSWTPISGYGNWIPVDDDSNCPNKFRDTSGKWWCSGAGSGNGSGGAGGSAASAGSGTGASAGSAASAAGQCDPTATNYLSCIQQQTVSSAASAHSTSSRSGSSSGTFSSLGEKGEFDGETSEKKMEELEEELNEKIADIKEDILAQVGGTISGSGTIQDFCETINNAEVCFGFKKWEPLLHPIAGAIFLVACVISFSIILRG